MRAQVASEEMSEMTSGPETVKQLIADASKIRVLYVSDDLPPDLSLDDDTFSLYLVTSTIDCALEKSQRCCARRSCN